MEGRVAGRWPTPAPLALWSPSGRQRLLERLVHRDLSRSCAPWLPASGRGRNPCRRVRVRSIEGIWSREGCDLAAGEDRPDHGGGSVQAQANRPYMGVSTG